MHDTSQNRISRVLIFSLFLVYFFFLNSCSSNTVSQSAGTLFGPDFGADAMNAAIKGAEAGTGLSDMLLALAQGVAKGVFGLTTPQAPPFSGTPAEINCSDGGTVLVTGFDATMADFSFQLTFSNCREDGIQIDGFASATGSSSIRDASGGRLDLRLSLGHASADLLIQNFQTVNQSRYGHLKSLFSTDMILGLQMQSGAIGTYTLTAEGEGIYDDFSEKVNVTFLDFKNETTTEIRSETAGEIVTKTTAFNGVIRQSNPSDIVDAGLRLSVLAYDDLVSKTVTTPSASGQTETRSYSGDFTLNLSASSCNIQGDFSIQTLDPLRYVDGANCPVSGHLKLGTISGDVDLLVNTDQSINIDAAGGQKVFDDCEDFFGHCALENFQGGFLSKAGLPGTPATGERQFITLTWEDTPSFLQASDMDLHVGYYLDPEPNPLGAANALVSWHSGGGDDCGSARAPSLFNGVEAILDIDDCSAFGPEHVSISGLPAGYYVVAVNSFDMKSVGSTIVNVTIEIGKEVFTFDKKTFLVSDKDQSNPNAWYRVTDLQCFSEGQCTFVAPNLALKVHDNGSLF